MGQQYHGGYRPADGLQDRMERIEREIELIAGSLRLAGRGEMPPTAGPPSLGHGGTTLPRAMPSVIVGNAVHGAQQERQQKAKVARRIIAERRRRERAFGPELFADPAWDMLLDLYAAHQERRQVSISSLCIAAAVPATTALRWIKTMTDKGILCRAADEHDGRRIYVHLDEKAVEAMDQFLEAREDDGGRMSI